MAPVPERPLGERIGVLRPARSERDKGRALLGVTTEELVPGNCLEAITPPPWAPDGGPAKPAREGTAGLLAARRRESLLVEEDQPVFDGQADQTRQVGDPEFGHDRGAVFFDGLGAEVEDLADFGVGVAFRHQLQHLPLPGR